jgi:hypothetical protein
MRALLILAVGGVVLAGAQTRLADTSLPVAETDKIDYGGFAVVAGTCAPAETDCEARGPKAWSSGDVAILKAAVNAIVRSSAGKAVIAAAQQGGVREIRRYSSEGGRSESQDGPPSAGRIALLRRVGPTAAIDLHDPYFARGQERDAFSGRPGYLLVAEVLLHECFHALDTVSQSPEFLRLVGFSRAGATWRFEGRTSADVTSLTSFSAQYRRLADKGDWAGIWRANRSLALSMRPVRVPSMMSVRSPAEAFAEIGAHLILDPRARTYLPPETVAYFDAYILPPISTHRGHS